MSIDAQILGALMLLAIYICFSTLFIVRGGKKSFLSPLNFMFVSLALHALSGCITYIQDYTHSSIALQYIGCIAYSVFGHLTLFFYGRYYVTTCGTSEKSRKIITYLNDAFLAINLLVTLPLIPSGLYFTVTEECVYTRGSLFFLSYVFVVVELLSLAVFSAIAIKKKKKAVAYIIFGLFPLLVSLLILFIPISSIILDCAMAISCFVLYSLVDIEDREKSLENESRLTKYKADIMLSQIGPHFIYNTLSTISALCVIDPKKAQTLSEDFTDYLRNNLNLAKSDRLSSFQEELNHTKKYLEIEHVRFGNRLNMEYDIKETDFHLPSLSLQPIVENAVKHGILRKDEGGTIKISTEKHNNQYIVTVTDNGVGFNPASLSFQEGHYGIANTKERLRLLMGGELKIDSSPGHGTTVKMYINCSTTIPR